MKNKFFEAVFENQKNLYILLNSYEEISLDLKETDLIKKINNDEKNVAWIISIHSNSERDELLFSFDDIEKCLDTMIVIKENSSSSLYENKIRVIFRDFSFDEFYKKKIK